MPPPNATNSSKQPSPPPIDISKSELVEGFANLLNTGKGLDLTITCNGSTFKVHKVVLASRSDFFATACWGGFQEAQSNCIDLPYDDPELVKKMLDYFYLLDYESDDVTSLYVAEIDCGTYEMTSDLAMNDTVTPEMCDKIMRLQEALSFYWANQFFEELVRNNLNYDDALHSIFWPGKKDGLVQNDCKQAEQGAENSIMSRCHRLSLIPKLAIDASMYGIADKYGIDGLKSISAQRLKTALQHDVWTRGTQHGYTPNMIEELATAIQATWTSTPASDDGVRAPLLDYVLKNKEALLEVEEFKLVIQDTTHFAYDLLFQSLKRKSGESLAAQGKRSKCNKNTSLSELLGDD